MQIESRHVILATDRQIGKLCGCGGKDGSNGHHLKKFRPSLRSLQALAEWMGSIDAAASALEARRQYWATRAPRVSPSEMRRMIEARREVEAVLLSAASPTSKLLNKARKKPLKGAG